MQRTRVHWTNENGVELTGVTTDPRELLTAINSLGGYLRVMEDLPTEPEQLKSLQTTEPNWQCPTCRHWVRVTEAVHLKSGHKQVRMPIDQELFDRTAPAWNCVTSDGPHYLHPLDGSCQWCGKSREALARETVR